MVTEWWIISLGVFMNDIGHANLHTVIWERVSVYGNYSEF